MTLEELKREAKRQGYNLIPAHKEKFLRCLCGANRHQYTSGPEGKFYSCKRCGLEAPPVVKDSDMIKAQNKMIKERMEENEIQR